MFVLRLVSGVRSSCEASATSCRCARLESSSAASIVLKLVASRPSSSSPVEVDSIRCERSRVSVTASVVCGQPPHRRERCARDEQAERGRNRDPADRDQDQEERDPVQRAVHLRQRPRDLHARMASPGWSSTRKSTSPGSAALL